MLFTVTREKNITKKQYDILLFFFTFKIQKLLSTIHWFWSLIAHHLPIFDSVTFEFQGVNGEEFSQTNVLSKVWAGWKAEKLPTLYVYTDIFLFLVVFHHTTYCQKMPKVQKKHKTIHDTLGISASTCAFWTLRNATLKCKNVSVCNN